MDDTRPATPPDVSDRQAGGPPSLQQHTPLRPFLIAVLVTSLLLGFIAVVQAVAPRPTWRFLYPVVFFAALEGILTTRWLRHPDRRQLNRALYRLAEYTVLALILRFLTWALTDTFPDLETWRLYFLSPLSFLDSTYFIFLLAAYFAWQRGIVFSTLFERLALSHAEVVYYSLPQEEQRRSYEDRPIDRERPAVFSALIQQWLGGGFLLALAAAITTVDVTTVVDFQGLQNIARLGLPPLMLGALLVYFLLGLWLISQARLTMMRSRWIAEGLETPPAMMRTWNRAALSLLLLIAFIAAFLPIGSTIGFARLLQIVVGVTYGVVQLLFLLFSFILYALLSLIGSAPEGEGEPPFGMEQPAPAPLPTAEPLGETATLLLGAFFWTVVAIAAVIAVVFFLQDRGYRFGTGFFARWWQRFREWLSAFWLGASRQATSLTHAVRSRLGREEEQAGTEKGSSWRFIRVNALPPTEQVRYFYLSTVRRAGEQGVPRGPGETPSEYAQDLREKWPEADAEIEALTGAFLEARYSRHSFSTEDVHPVKRVWRRVRAALRRR